MHYATAAGRQAGSDFQDASDTLSWDDGDTSDRFITIDLIDDAEVEGDENFSLTLSEADGWRHACGQPSHHEHCERRLRER